MSNAVVVILKAVIYFFSSEAIKNVVAFQAIIKLMVYRASDIITYSVMLYSLVQWKSALLVGYFHKKHNVGASR